MVDAAPARAQDKKTKHESGIMWQSRHSRCSNHASTRLFVSFFPWNIKGNSPRLKPRSKISSRGDDRFQTNPGLETL